MARLRVALGAAAEGWDYFEPLPGAEEGMRIEGPRDILDSYLSVLLVRDGGYSVAAAMLSSYLGGNAAAVRFLSEAGTGGMQVAYFHPSLATKRARSLDVAETAWGIVAQEPRAREQFARLCAEAVEGCTGIETLRVRGARILGLMVRWMGEEAHFIPLDTLGDGQRSVVLLSLLALYLGLLNGRRLFAVDTPEAYTHPDLQATMARAIVDAAKEYNVVLATQSIEFLREILLRASIEGVLERIRLLRLRVSGSRVKESLLTMISREEISGAEAYSLVEEGFDVRLYNAVMHA